jgi:hypothetical protein
MTARKLQPGETLRIRSGGRLLVVRASTAWEVRIVKRNLGIRIKRALIASWLRMHRFGAATVRRLVRAA